MVERVRVIYIVFSSRDINREVCRHPSGQSDSDNEDPKRPKSKRRRHGRCLAWIGVAAFRRTRASSGHVQPTSRKRALPSPRLFPTILEVAASR